MILTEIKKYLIQHNRVTLGDLARHFDIEPETIKGMMAQWIKKDRVLQTDRRAGCSKNCERCFDRKTMEIIYEWKNASDVNPVCAKTTLYG